MSSSDATTTLANYYTREFFQGQSSRTPTSAGVIAPLLRELLKPTSLVDVGCGTGSWLAAFMEMGIRDVLGVDGEYLQKRDLVIPADRFVSHDLTRPLNLGRKFDLVLSLEVGEHLPDDAADSYVDSLADLGSVIVFSAAVPGQGGVHHVNEQWPGYWAAKFKARGFEVIDCLRPRLWSMPGIDWYYAQNMMLFVDRAELARRPELVVEKSRFPHEPLPLVHPKMYHGLLYNTEPATISLGRAWRLFRDTVRHAIRRRMPGSGAMKEVVGAK